MKSVLLFTLLASIATSTLADWPQWRGPNRNGTVDGSPSLPAELTESNAPVQVWEFEGIPSDHYGGHGSVAVVKGKLYLSVVWHRDEPTEFRKIDNRVTGALGYRGTKNLPPEVVKKMEHDRINLPRRLRGSALDEYAKKWVEENLDKKTQLSLGSWVAGRFKKGKAAIPLTVYDSLVAISNKTFKDQAEMEAWVNAQDFDQTVKEQIIAAVPDTKRAANDVIICIDAATGKEIWRYEVAGFPSGRGSSSTPAVVDGKVYASLSENLYCVDAETGKEIWKAKLKGRKGPASSPLVYAGKVFLQQNYLTAFDTKSGRELWQNKEVKGSNQSPALWKNVILCNSSKELLGIDSATGKTLWEKPGGGDGTPVVSGEVVVVSSKAEGKNLIAYQLTEQEAVPLWSQEFSALRYGSSPIIFEGYVYHLGSNRHLCINLKSGEIEWERKASSSISSPILADGKLLVYENRGGYITMLKATPEDYTSLGRAKIGALRCASPAMVGKDLFFRAAKSVKCFRFK